MLRRVAIIAFPLVLLWLASLYGAYRLGLDAGWQLGLFSMPEPSTPTYGDCKTVQAFPGPGDGPNSVGQVNQLQAAGYRIDRQQVSGDGRVAYFTLCK